MMSREEGVSTIPAITLDQGKGSGLFCWQSEGSITRDARKLENSLKRQKGEERGFTG